MFEKGGAPFPFEKNNSLFDKINVIKSNNNTQSELVLFFVRPIDAQWCTKKVL